jgi:hypothetical protein
MTSNVLDIVLNNADRILFAGKTYKIIERKDYSYMLRQLGFALSRYIKSVILRKVTTNIVEGEAVNTYNDISFRAMVQPLKYSELQLMSDEQRSWDWLKITPFTLLGNVDYYCIEDYIES